MLRVNQRRNHRTRASVHIEWMRRTVGVLLGILVLSSCIAGDGSGTLDSTPTQAPTTPVPEERDRRATWAVRGNERLGVAIQVPPRWSLVWNPLRQGTVGDILVSGSWRFPKLPECEPIPPGEALLAVSEVGPVIASVDYTEQRLEREFPPRPRRFETTVLRSLGVRKGCDQPKAQLFRFREAGRFLYAWVMFGRDLPTGVRTKAEAVLSTLDVDSRA
jgi:hypothetical protein